MLAAEAKDVAGEVFNVGCGARYTLNYLLERLNAILGTDVSAVYEQPRPGDVRHSQASIEKANRLLGYAPVVTFEEGLRQTVEWFRQSKSTSC